MVTGSPSTLDARDIVPTWFTGICQHTEERLP